MLIGSQTLGKVVGERVKKVADPLLLRAELDHHLDLLFGFDNCPKIMRR